MDDIELGRQLGRMDEKLGELHADVQEVKADFKELKIDVADVKAQTNGRLRKIEVWQARAEGARAVTQKYQPFLVAVVGGAASAVGFHFLAG